MVDAPLKMDNKPLGIEEASVGYQLPAVRSAQLLPGYKQTEVGVIPEDWEIDYIGQVFHLINGCAFKPADWKQQGTPIIRIQNLNDRNAPFNYCDTPVDDRYHVAPGDLLFAWSGTTGTSFGARVWGGPSGVLNQHIFKVIADQRKLTSAFSLLILQQVQEDIEKKAHGFKSSFVHVKKSDLTRVPLPIPLLSEQRAIAAALSDVDALTGGLDRLIAKKRDLKQATMQQLLTGQTRLPGFSGEWEVKRLGECLIARPDYGINASAVPYSDQLPVYIRITDISDDSRFSPQSPVSVNSPNSSLYYLSDGDLVFARTGASVGKSYLYNLHDGPLVFAGFLIRVRPDVSQLRPAFLGEFVKTSFYWKWVRTTSMRSGQPGINGNEFAQLPISLPSITEQAAIATILSDMDAEITALEARRDKTHVLKQGMIQELLTGRIRLV